MHAIYTLVPLLAARLLASAASSESPSAFDRPPLPPPKTAPAAVRWTGAGATFERLANDAEQKARAKSPLALGALYRAQNFDRLLEQHDRMGKLLDVILSLPRVDPLLAAHARSMAASLDLRRGARDRAQARIAMNGLAKRAMVLGPFENSAAQGHFEPYSPELDLDLDTPVPGKDRLLRWRPLEGMADLGAFELSLFVTPPEEATVYVLTAIESERAASVVLRTGSTDQLKIFHDGVEVFALDSRRAAALDQDAIPLALPRGRSLLLIKCSWTASTGRLLFRITDSEGRPAPGVQLLGDRATIASVLEDQKSRGSGHASTKGTADKASARPLGLRTVTSDIDAFVKTAKGAELAAALSLRADLSAILGLYDRRKLPTPPEDDLYRAIQLDPGNPTLRFFFAHRVEERDPALTHEQLEAALQADPGHVMSLYKLGEMARSSGRVIEARARLEAAIARDPEFLPAIVSLAELRFDGVVDRELGLMDLRSTAHRLNAATLDAVMARMLRASEDRQGARAFAESALKKDQSDSRTRNLLIDLFMDANARDEAVAELDRAIALEPHIVGYRMRKARVLAGLTGHLDEALALVAETERLFPDNPDVPELAAELALFKNQKTEAIAALDRALAIDPFQPDLRRHHGSLTGHKAELEDEYTIDVAPLAHAPVSPEEKSYGAIYLAERTAIRLYENGQGSRFVQTVVRLDNPSLKDALRIHRIGYSPSREVVEVLTAERVRPNGEVMKASSISDNGEDGKVGGMYIDRRTKGIVFDDMAKGDLIHIRYRVDSVGPNMFGSFFGDVEPFQGGIPKLGVLYAVISPKQRPLNIGLTRVGPPKVEDDGKTVRRTWTLDHVDALENEPFAPPYSDIGALVNVSTYERWEDLGKWYAGLFTDQLELDSAARAAGRKVVANAKDDADKIRRLYAYVVKNTRYVGIELGIHGWKPFKAAEVHRRRYGDCKDKATLLAALLADNGISATVALVRTADRGSVDVRPATMWAFNHAITYVPSLDLFLDGTAEFSGSRELPWMDQGASALVVYPDGRTQLSVLPESKPEDNLNESSYVARFEADGALTLKGRERFFGARASQLRQEFEEVGERKSRLEKQLNQVFQGVHIDKLEFSDMSDLEVPVHYDYEASIPRYGTEDRGRWIIPLTLFQHQVSSAYASSTKRKYTLWSNHAWATRNVIRYELPEGATLETLPEGVTIDSKYVSLVERIRVVPGGFETDDLVTLKSRRIPAEDYEEFRNACLAIDRALGRSVVIRW